MQHFASHGDFPDSVLAILKPIPTHRLLTTMRLSPYFDVVDMDWFQPGTGSKSSTLKTA